MKTLLLIDIQNDFLPGGALAVPEGDQVIAVANEAMSSADHVVATQDWHPENHGSFASQHTGVEVGQLVQLNGLDQIAWPDHCVQGTAGAEFAASLNSGAIKHISQKGTDAKIDSYSGFFDNGKLRSTDLDQHLKSVGSNQLTVMGLATDYCVKFSVLDALELGYSVEVLLSGCRGVNLNDGDVENAIEEMRAAGAVIL